MPRYRAPSAGAWVAVDLQPFSAVYHRTSGTTHLLIEPAPQLLEVLGAEAMTLAELRARLESEYEVGDSSDAALNARLEELVEAGLVTVA